MLGIVLDTARTPSGTQLVALAHAAEQHGLDLVVIAPGLDPWTVATWVAASTSRVPIGISVAAESAPDPSDPEQANPAVLDKARESLALLVGPRLVENGWVVASADADAAQVRALAQPGRTVVIPVRTVAEVERVVDLLPERPRSSRSTAARSKRVQGIDYEGVPDSLRERAIEPGDPGYRAVRSTYMRGGAPGLVLRPRSAGEVAEAVRFAAAHRTIPLSLRSGGHGFSGRSTNRGGLVIDVGAMNQIEVIDTDQRVVRVGPGATWKQVAQALAPYHWAISSGDHGGVGVGGLATAGGIGLLGRAHGLTIDHVRAVELVLADGTQVRASTTENPDLFWAVRGAGANMGIATAFELQADEVPLVGWAQLTFVSDDLEHSLLAYGRAQSRAPRDTTLFLVTGPPQQGQSVLQLYGMVESSDPDTIIERLNPFVEVGALAQQQVVLTTYASVMATAPDAGLAGHRGVGEPVARSGLLPTLSPEFARAAALAMSGGQIRWFQLRAMGGAIADVRAGETAFSGRDAGFQVTALAASHTEMDRAWAPLAAHMAGLYLSFDTAPGPERVAEAFPPPVLERLRDLKRRYDPDLLFRDNFPVIDQGAST